MWRHVEAASWHCKLLYLYVGHQCWVVIAVSWCAVAGSGHCSNACWAAVTNWEEAVNDQAMAVCEETETMNYFTNASPCWIWVQICLMNKVQ
jgi:hypothetical protein